MGSDSTWEKIKAIPKALKAAAGESTPGPAPKPSAAPTWRDNTVIERRPLGMKDTNLPIKGSVYDRPKMARGGGLKK